MMFQKFVANCIIQIEKGYESYKYEAGWTDKRVNHQ